MHIFMRTNTVNRERPFDALAFSIEIAEYASKVSGLTINAWQTVYGRPQGSLAWSAQVDSQAAMAAAGDKLLADPGYQEKISQATPMFSDMPEDYMSEVLHAAGPGGDLGPVSTFVTAQVAGGHFADALEWGVEMTNHIGGLSNGANHLFIRSIYGEFGTLGWITLADTMEQVDAANTAMAADDGYIKLLDKAADMFVPASATSTLSRRIN